MRILRMAAPPAQREFDEKIAGLRREKESAIDCQDFERAAALRAGEKQLSAKRNARKKKWKAGGMDAVAEVNDDQIVTVDVAGTGPAAQLTFKGVPKPGEVPGTPPAEIDSKAAARRDRRGPGQRRVTSPGQRLSSPSRGVLRSLTRRRRGQRQLPGPGPGGGSPGGVPGAGNPAMACDLELPLPVD